MNDSHPQSAATRKANRHFRKEAAEKDGVAALAEYRADQAAVLEKTARLREQRLARDATLPKATPKAAKAKRKTVSRALSSR
ncbi:hypothetical protein [Blastochloris sulfoviridis]|uniref:Uncharacterized protein n=1 Tax=Blastochloris sulfoviridis TaxID=50712 RepID=A0A5M6HR27_9HYPH|nr:hypothetical protein [Blastochloris sulfoviridis]KAA5598158.1 hypothetical protein F1193_14015 [Blastochloris sulfoviridis]